MQVLIRKHSVSIKRYPEEQQEKRYQSYSGQLWLGFGATRQDGDNCHKRHHMKEEQRIGNRVLGNFHVQTKFVVQLKVLVQGPQPESSRKQEPERPASKRVLDSVADRKSGCQHQKKEIADPAV